MTRHALIYRFVCVCPSASAPGVSEDDSGEDTEWRERAGGVSAKLGVPQGDTLLLLLFLL